MKSDFFWLIDFGFLMWLRKLTKIHSKFKPAVFNTFTALDFIFALDEKDDNSLSGMDEGENIQEEKKEGEHDNKKNINKKISV